LQIARRDSEQGNADSFSAFTSEHQVRERERKRERERVNETVSDKLRRG
jgi:hypothetical protein